MIPEPKHDAESLALEEQFGATSLELNFGEEGRFILKVDGRKAARQLNEIAARLDRFASDARRKR